MTNLFSDLKKKRRKKLVKYSKFIQGKRKVELRDIKKFNNKNQIYNLLVIKSKVTSSMFNVQ